MKKNIIIFVYVCFMRPPFFLKGVFAKNERGYRLNAIKKRLLSLLILLLSVASIKRKLLKTSHTEITWRPYKFRKLQHTT